MPAPPVVTTARARLRLQRAIMKHMLFYYWQKNAMEQWTAHSLQRIGVRVNISQNRGTPCMPQIDYTKLSRSAPLQGKHLSVPTATCEGGESPTNPCFRGQCGNEPTGKECFRSCCVPFWQVQSGVKAVAHRALADWLIVLLGKVLASGTTLRRPGHRPQPDVNRLQSPKGDPQKRYPLNLANPRIAITVQRQLGHPAGLPKP